MSAGFLQGKRIWENRSFGFLIQKICLHSGCLSLSFFAKCPKIQAKDRKNQASGGKFLQQKKYFVNVKFSDFVCTARNLGPIL